MADDQRGPGGPTLLGRVIHATSLGAVLVGLSLVQGEFDFGVPQFQVLFLPILVALAAGFALVLARVALGPWGGSRRWLPTWPCGGSSPS